MTSVLQSAPANVSALESYSLPQLRQEAAQLERELEDRKLLFLDICESSGTAASITPSSAAGRPSAGGRISPSAASARSPSKGARTPSEGARSPSKAAGNAGAFGAEGRRLATRNIFLTRELQVLDERERMLAMDPRVVAKRNETAMVRKQIKEAEREIATLQTMKKRRDSGLRAIGRTEEEVRRIRGHQHEANAELREEAHRLGEELRKIEKVDLEVHDRYATLQDQVKLAVTEADVKRLREEVAAGEKEVEQLAAQETVWNTRRTNLRSEARLAGMKLRQDIGKLEVEEAALQKQMRQKERDVLRSRRGVSPVDASNSGSGSQPGSRSGGGSQPCSRCSGRAIGGMTGGGE